MGNGNEGGWCMKGKEGTTCSHPLNSPGHPLKPETSGPPAEFSEGWRRGLVRRGVGWVGGGEAGGEEEEEGFTAGKR